MKMRPLTSRVCLLLAMLLTTASAWAGKYAVVGGQVHTLTEEQPLHNAVVLIDDAQVVAVGEGLAVPADYERIDATGKIVTPGFIESYSQLSLDEIGGEESTVDSVVVDYASGAAFDVRYAINPESTALAVNRRDGVTQAIVAPQAGNDPFAGWGVAIQLTNSEPLLAVDVALFGSIGAQTAAFTGGSRSALIQRLRRGLTQAAAYNASRYQPGPGDYSHQDLAALQRFLKAEIPLVLEAHRATEIREAMALARDFKLKLVVEGGSEAWKVREQLAEQQVPVIVNVLANLPASFERLGARLDNAALLHEAGVTVLLTGGETANVRWLRQAAGNAVANGLPWNAALRALTSAPAEVWGLTRGSGTLAAGAPANLVIWTADPFELTSWPEEVMIAGERQDLSSRQTLLFERYRNLPDAMLYYR